MILFLYSWVTTTMIKSISIIPSFSKISYIVIPLSNFQTVVTTDMISVLINIAFFWLSSSRKAFCIWIFYNLA